jgi:hypothetical protein
MIHALTTGAKRITIFFALVFMATAALIVAPVTTTSGPAYAPHSVLGEAPNAAQAANRLCHNGSYDQPPVHVIEYGGSSYNVYPHDCTPGDVGVFGFRPLYGNTVYYRRGSDTTLRVCRWVSSTQYCSTLGYNISVVAVIYNVI